MIIFPHVGGTSQSMVNGVPMTGGKPIPYKKSADTPNFGGVDETDDIRGGMGMEGLQELGKFVQQGGTLIADGSTAALMAEYNLGGGVTVEHPANLFARGTLLRGMLADLKSPIAYGYEGKDLPVYFNQDPVLSVSRRRLRRRRWWLWSGGGWCNQRRHWTERDAQWLFPSRSLRWT